MKKVLLLLTSLLLFTTIAVAANKTYGNLYDVIFVSNYDGDTIKVVIPYVHPVLGDKINIRVYGVDTPEIRGKCAEEKAMALVVKQYVHSILVDAEYINLLDIKRGKYFRIVASIITDKGDLSELLLTKGYAVAYFGGTKNKDWCD